MAFRILIILAIATMSGCNDSGLEPRGGTLEGLYVLEAVKGTALPAVVRENEHTRTTVLADTLEFVGPRITRAVTLRLFDKTTGQTNTTAVEYTDAYRILAYDRRGAVIEFLCDDTAVCADRFLGRISHGGIMMTGVADAETYRYRRIP